MSFFHNKIILIFLFFFSLIQMIRIKTRIYTAVELEDCLSISKISRTKLEI